MRARLSIVAIMAFLAWGCSSTGGGAEDHSKDKLIDRLTLFVEAVQMENFDKAFAYLTPAEKGRMMEGGGQVPDHVRRQLQALRLSTLAHKPGVKLTGGRLEGIYEQLPGVGAPAGESTSREKDSPEV